MRVLIVDDSVTLRRLSMNVVREGYPDAEFVEASDGLYAKGLLEGVDLILLGWNMPGMNGYDFLVWLRKKKESEIPVVMVTSEANKENVIRALQAGATQYVVKPFTIQGLLSKIRNCVGDPDPEPELEE